MASLEGQSFESQFGRPVSTSTVNSTVEASTVSSELSTTVSSILPEINLTNVSTVLSNTLTSTVSSFLNNTLGTAVPRLLNNTLGGTLPTFLNDSVTSTVQTFLNSTVASTVPTFFNRTLTSSVPTFINSTFTSTVPSFFNSTLTSTVPTFLNTTLGSPVSTFLHNATSDTVSNSSFTHGSEVHVPLTNLTSTDMMAPLELILTAIPLSLISLVIILGNLLVILAVFTQKSLRSPQNIYIVSLAAADMSVGVVILPFSITYLVLRRWPLGPVLCKLWLTGDVAVCCVSIFHLCAIGIDRYRAITDGINYVQRRNLKSVMWTILVLWLLAAWIASPPILAMNDWSIRYDGNECSLPINVGYAFHLAIGALFFPLVIMSVIYAKIYYAIKERLKERARVTCIELTSDADTTERLESEQSTDEVKVTTSKKRDRRKPSAQISTFLVNKQKFSLSRERKAARTLGIIMGAFVVCWLPLGFLNVIGSCLPVHLQPGDGIFHTLTWLGYVNSALNPIIYAVSNQEFQKAFRRVLHMG